MNQHILVPGVARDWLTLNLGPGEPRAAVEEQTLDQVRTLDRFLENPVRAVPGTAMGYAGIADSSERAALIAYLKQANGSAECQTQGAGRDLKASGHLLSR